MITAHLQLEINTIINTIAPPHTVQYKIDFKPYMTRDLRTYMETTKQLLQKAIRTQEFEHWTEYKNHRNNTQ